MNELKYRVFSWDWKEQPNWEAINTCLREIRTPYFHYINTDSDEYAVLLADQELSIDLVKHYYQLHLNGQ